jgi:hypothetical protein
MQYVLLIHGNDEKWAATPEETKQGIYAQFGELMRDPAFRGGAQLQPSATAVTVQEAGGEIVTTDGPFAETKEQLGGYVVVECDDFEQALEYASRIPTLALGDKVEVRPLVVRDRAPVA